MGRSILRPPPVGPARVHGPRAALAHRLHTPGAVRRVSLYTVRDGGWQLLLRAQAGTGPHAELARQVILALLFAPVPAAGAPDRPAAPRPTGAAQADAAPRPSRAPRFA